MNVLLVEDDREMAKLLTEKLEEGGHTVAWADTLVKARGFLTDESAGLIGRFDKGVFDMNLPDGLGTDLIAARPFGFPVAFYSGLPGDVERKLRSMGVDGHPVFPKEDPHALLAWIERT